MGIIVLFFPAVISLYVDLCLNNKKSLTIIDSTKYFIYCLLVNFFGNLLVWLISNEKYYHYNITTFTYDFCVKYMIITISVAAILPILFKIIVDNIKISIEVKEKNDKSNK